MADRIVTISHLGRVEGHGGIAVHLTDDGVIDVDMEIHEGSRFYESLLRGKRFLDVQGIITRVCAICSAGHTVAAVTALENALAVEVSERVVQLRELLLLGGTIESHALHVFALALPDYLGFDSVISMAADYPDEVVFALKLKQLGNTIQAAVGGRAVHPINTVVGGFGKLPDPDDLLAIRRDLIEAVEPLIRLVGFVSTIETPSWAVRPAAYVSVRPGEQDYGFTGSSIVSSTGVERPVEAYRALIREYWIDHSNARHAELESGDPYIVGALARLRLWGDRLRGRAAEACSTLFPGAIVDNILLNNRAQLVELVHCVERAADLCGLLARTCGPDQDLRRFRAVSGRGVAAVEVPRGTLIHEYVIDDEGCVVSADVVTPTSQNLASTEIDLRQTARHLLTADRHVNDAAIESKLGMVARAYDPCISCSVHVVRDR